MGAAAGFRRLAHSFSELLSEQVKLPMILVQRRGSIGMTKGPNGWDFDPIKTCHKSEREWDWHMGCSFFGGNQFLVFERTTKGTAQWTRFADLSKVASSWLERSSRDIQRLCWSDLWEGQRGNLIPDHLTGTWGWCTTLFEIAAAGRLLPEVRLRTELSDTAKLWRQVTELEIVMGTKLEYLRPILQLHRSALPHELGDTLTSHLDDLVIAAVVGSEYLADLCDTATEATVRTVADDLAARPSHGLSRDEYNAVAMEIAKIDRAFAKKPNVRKWSERLGCATGLVSLLPFYIACAEKAGTRRKGKPLKPKVVSLDNCGERGGEDEDLARLIGEQRQDAEPSPLDKDAPGQRRKVRIKKKL